MPIQVPVTQTGLEASIQAAAQRAGRNLKIDLGVNSRSIGSLSQPLGKITGQADQFTKSMEAANARVLAFGASVGVLSAVAQGFREIVNVTIQVEKNMADINSVLGANSTQLNKFKNDIFSVAKETGNSFQTVSDAALELSRQGLKPVEVLTRLKDSMILSRLSGLDAASSVEGLTAAVNSFSKEGVTTSQVLNKISKTAAAFSVSERDLIEGFKRSASVAQQAGVSLDELGGIITAVQEKTARGGAVIGNAFKTIFTRIQRPDSLALLQEVGAQVTDVQGRILPATKLIENLAQKISGLNDVQVANITEKIGGGFQVGPLIAALDDINSATSTFKGATEAMSTAGSEAYKRNIALNQTLAASINTATVNLQELANTLGEIGVTDSLKNILSFFNSFATDVKEVLQGEGLGSDFAKGLVKGISAVLSGPGLILFAAIIGKLALNFVQFGAAALKTFFNIGSAAKEIGAIQSGIASTLLNNKSIQTQILALEGDRVAQARFFSTALNTQLATMEKMRSIAASIAPAVYTATTGAGKPRAAGGYMPTVMAEANDISKGVGGARPSDRPVVIPNFSFGNGKKGTMVAHTGEHIVPNYNGSGGSAIFNREMVGRMGLPSGAKKIGAAGGFVPNFVDLTEAESDLAIAERLGVINNARKDTIDITKLKTKAKGKSQAGIDARALLSRLEGSKEEKTKQLLRYNFSDSVAAKKENRGVAFGMIVNEPYTGGSKTAYAYKNSKGEVIATATQTPNSEAAINVPIYGVNKNRIESQTTGDLISSITDYLVKRTIELAQELGHGVVPDKIRKSAIASTFNKGSAASAAGSVFESAIGSLLSDDDFSDFQNRAAGSLMDFTGSSVKNLKLAPNVFDIPKNEANVGLEAKGSQALFTGAAEKIFKINQGAQAFSIKQDKTKSQLNKGITAASGYIPNFANYVYDADRLSPELRASILPAILATAKPKTKDEEIKVIDALLGPAGSGKSTFASKIGPFIKSMADVKKAERFTILSASSLAKDPSGISKPFRSVIEAIKNSGGTLRYLNVSDEEIKKRRENRIAKGSMEGDLRSESNLKGVSYASLNQPEFLDILKKEMGGSFKLESGASGYIPNFVSQSREMGRGVQGAFYRLGEKDGAQVGVKKFFKDGPSRAVETEWLVAEFLSKYAKIPSVFGPKNLSTLSDSKRKQSIRKEVVSDPLAKAALGSEVSSAFGRSVLFNALGARGLHIGDLHGSNYTVNKRAEDSINELRNYPQDAVGSFSVLRSMAQNGSEIGILDPGAARVSDPARSVIGKIIAQQSKQASGGYIPNFAKNQEFEKSLLTNSKIDPSSPMLSLKAGDQTNYGKFLKIEPAGNPKGKYLNAIFESSATGKNVKYSSDQKKRMEFGGGLFWDSVIKEIVPNKNLKNRLYSNDFYSSLANPASKYADVSSKMKVFFDSKGKLDGENLRMHEWNSGTGFSDNISVDGKNLVIEDINPNFDKPIQFNNLYLKALNQAAADLKLKVIKRSSLSNKISNKGESQRFREGFVGSVPKSYAEGFIPNFAIDTTKSQSYIESQRKRNFKAKTYRRASGIIGSLFKTLPEKFFSDGVLGDSAQGMETNGIFDLIKNSALYAASYGGPKAMNLATEAGKYGLKISSGLQKRLSQLAVKGASKIKGYAGGYVPNFADPLNEAISREIGAGVNPSQVYIDQNNSLKNPMNPSGLMVANRRDEPSGGWQGINRARKEGANAQTYGAAGGFVPNFAEALSVKVSKETGVKINAGPAQQAIDEFAVEASKAGANMEKLTSELSKKLASFTKENIISKQLAQASQSEISERQKSIATKILESNAGKKLAAQLDKIYLEYNKSKKTAQDLQNAQAKAAAILNQSGLNQPRNQAAIINSTASLAGSRQSAQSGAGSRDMLGTVFAVQAGLSLLTGATSDATSGMAKLSNAVGSVASAATSALFVGQGLKGLAKEGGVAAGVLGKVGIYGAVAAGAFEAFKQVGSYLDSTNLSINRASGAMDRVAKAAENASINLSKFRPAEVKAIKAQREALVSGAIRSGVTSKTFQSSGFGSGMGGGMMIDAPAVAKFEGVTDEMETEFEAMVDTALAAGVSYGKIWKMINESSKTGAKITAEEVASMSKEIESLTEIAAKFKPQDVIKKFDLKPTEGLGKKILSLDPNRLQGLLKGDSAAGKGIKEFLSGKGIAEGFGQNKALELVRDELSSLLSTKESETTQNIELLNVEYVKLLESLKGQAVYSKMMEGLAAKETNQRADLLSIAKDLTLTDTQRQRAIEDANNANEVSISIIRNQQSSFESLGNSLEDVMKKANLPIADFDKNFAAIKSKISDLEPQIEAAFAAGNTDQLKTLTDEIGKSLGLAGQNANIANASILTYINLLNTGKDKIYEQNDAKLAGLKLQRQENDLAITRNNIFEKAASLSNASLGRKSLAGITLEGQSQRLNIQKEIELATPSNFSGIYDSKSILAKREEIEAKYFKLNQDNALKRELNQIEIEAKRNAFTEKNILALGQNEKATRDLIDQLKAPPAIPSTGGIVGSLYPPKVSGVALSDLEQNLSRGLKPYAGAFESSGKKYGVDPKFLAAISELETGGGTSEAFLSKSNAMGISNTVGPTQQLSIEDSIDKMARIIASNTGPYRNASTIAEIGPIYAPPGAKNDTKGTNKGWYASVANKYKSFGGDPSRAVKYSEYASSMSAFSAGDKLGTDIYSAGKAIAGSNLSPEEATKKARQAAIDLGAKTEEAIISNVNQIMAVAQQIEAITAKQGQEKLTEKDAKKLRALSVVKPTSFTEGFGKGINSLKEQQETFAYDLGERAPALFADNMASAMEEIIMKGEDFGDSLRSAASSFLSEITKANIRNLASQFTTGGASAGGGIFSAIGSLFRTSSGPITMASGGPITGGSGNKDDVPAMLMGGEYVMNKKAVSKYGTRFMESLNNGSISGFADGGSVVRSRGFGSNVLDSKNIGDQTGQGGYQIPGYYGTGAITGGKNLLAYATQSYTSGAGDIIRGGANSAYLDLDPESIRLTQFGRTTGPMAAAVREAKGQAFGLYTQELEAKKQAEKEKEAEKKAFKNALLMAAITTAVGSVAKVGQTGFKEGFDKTGTFMGAVKGVGEKYGNVGSSISSLFSGNFDKASEFANMATTNFQDPKIPKAIIPNRATGGSIPQTSGIDTVPAMLSGGEFVMNAAATQRIGTNNLNAMNSGASTSNDSSAINEQLLSKLDELIRTTKESSKPVTVNVSSSQQGQAGGNNEESKSEQDQNLSRKIKAAVVAVLQEEKRLGGVLRRS